MHIDEVADFKTQPILSRLFSMLMLAFITYFAPFSLFLTLPLPGDGLFPRTPTGADVRARRSKDRR
jgi:hypothetical protein